MNSSFFILIFLVLILQSCGGRSKPKTDTTLRFVSGALTDPNFSGGLMVYGQSSEGDNFSLNITEVETVFPIPNGTWSFTALAWDGSSPLTGTIRCAEKEELLEGGEKNVSFTLSQTNCLASKFGTANFRNGNQFKPLRLVHCTDLSSVIDGTSDCSGVLSGTKSYEVSLTTFGDLQSTSLSSGCINEAALASGYTDTIINLPSGGEITDFLVVQVKTFKNSNCSGLTKEFVFQTGLESSITETAFHDHASFNLLFLDAPAKIIVPGITINQVANSQLSTSASFKIRARVATLAKETVSSSTNFKFKRNGKADIEKPKFSESTNFKLNIGHD